MGVAGISLLAYFVLLQVLASGDSTHPVPSAGWPSRQQFGSAVFYVTTKQEKILDSLWVLYWLSFVPLCVGAILTGDIRGRKNGPPD